MASSSRDSQIVYHCHSSSRRETQVLYQIQFNSLGRIVLENHMMMIHVPGFAAAASTVHDSQPTPRSIVCRTSLYVASRIVSHCILRSPFVKQIVSLPGTLSTPWSESPSSPSCAQSGPEAVTILGLECRRSSELGLWSSFGPRWTH